MLKTKCSILTDAVFGPETCILPIAVCVELDFHDVADCPHDWGNRKGSSAECAKDRGRAESSLEDFYIIVARQASRHRVHFVNAQIVALNYLR